MIDQRVGDFRRGLWVVGVESSGDGEKFGCGAWGERERPAVEVRIGGGALRRIKNDLAAARSADRAGRGDRERPERARSFAGEGVAGDDVAQRRRQQRPDLFGASDETDHDLGAAVDDERRLTQAIDGAQRGIGGTTGGHERDGLAERQSARIGAGERTGRFVGFDRFRMFPQTLRPIADLVPEVRAPADHFGDFLACQFGGVCLKGEHGIEQHHSCRIDMAKESQRLGEVYPGENRQRGGAHSPRAVAARGKKRHGLVESASADRLATKEDINTRIVEAEFSCSGERGHGCAATSGACLRIAQRAEAVGFDGLMRRRVRVA